MMTGRVRYPIGLQSFRKLREKGCVYVDKTHFIPELTWTSDFIFLSRPRRFGKSLMLSTLEAYFRGEKVVTKFTLPDFGNKSIILNLKGKVVSKDSIKQKNIFV